VNAAALEAAPALPAAGSSFYTAMRILPRPEREAMYAIYAFCRAVDDIADGQGPREQRQAALAAWHVAIDDLYAGAAPARARMLEEPVARFGMQAQDFHAVIDGMEMDLDTMRAPEWAVLDLYCDRVASAVGRLSGHVFGLSPEQNRELPHHLGRALQLTNILRDLDEDAELGRLYLPREALREAGIEATDPVAALAHRNLDAACRAVAARARAHFGEADRVMRACARRTIRAPRLMEAAYRSILDRLERRGWSAPRARVRADKTRVLLAIARHGLL
jgi:squalene synthase HpnD